MATKPVDPKILLELGKQNYLAYCSVCHKIEGGGTPPAYPALKGSKVATGPVAEHIRTVLHGRKGTAMQAFEELLTDKQIASIITYERNAWGNNDQRKFGKLAGGIVQPGDVGKARIEQ